MYRISLQKSLATAILVTTTILFIHSCSKQSSIPPGPKENFIIEAKSWFNNNIIAPEEKLLSTPFNALPAYSDLRRFARMGKLKGLLQWDNALSAEQNGHNYLIVPLNENIKPFSNKNFEAYRDFIFYKDLSGAIHLKVMEIISNKGTNLSVNRTELTAKVFENIQEGREQVPGNINGTIILYNEKYQQESSFKISNGNLYATAFSLSNKKKTLQRQALSTKTKLSTCSGCETYYAVGIWYDQTTGAVVDYEILSDWNECNPDIVPPYGSGPVYENPNKVLSEPQATTPTLSPLPNGKKQASTIYTKGFLLANVALNFCFDPVKQTLEPGTVSTNIHNGVFNGTWDQKEVKDVFTTGNEISFTVVVQSTSTIIPGLPYYTTYNISVAYNVLTNRCYISMTTN